MTTLRHLAADILGGAGWNLPPLPLTWSTRMVRCAGLFVIERDARGRWHPEIRLSVPLLRRADHAWPVQACGLLCEDGPSLTRRILEHELVHYKLWVDGEKNWGHSPKFRALAREAFGHRTITHGIGLGG